MWLAGAGMWIALGGAEVLAPGPAGWVRCDLCVLHGLDRARLRRRLPATQPRKGNGLSVRGRDDDDGPDGEAVHGWRTLTVVSRLMPASAGRRWLAEAESLLAEVAAARRGAAVRSYLLSAPRLAAMMWARQVLRRPRPGPRRPG